MTVVENRKNQAEPAYDGHNFKVRRRVLASVSGLKATNTISRAP